MLEPTADETILIAWAGKLRMSTLRRAVRRTADAIVGQAVWPLLKLSGPRLLVLAYHRILPREWLGSPLVQPGMVTTPETLAMHLEVLRTRVEFVHLDEWIERAQQRRPLPKTACALTFDDGWMDFYQYALPVLRAAGVPATLFAVADVIGTDRSLWPDRLARLLWNGGEGVGRESLVSDESHWLSCLGVEHGNGILPTQAAIDRIITAAKAFSDADIERRLSRIECCVGKTTENVTRDFLDWAELKAIVRTGLVRIGSHTRRHRRLRPDLGKHETQDEIRTSGAVLEERLGVRVRLFCYPNGDMTPEAVELVRDTYLGACTTRTGWNSSDADPYLLNRILLHEGGAGDNMSFRSRMLPWP